ncbi:MAG: type II toxin-antitoxin system HicB family antitoxin [Methanotrichaceae archaeon]
MRRAIPSTNNNFRDVRRVAEYLKAAMDKAVYEIIDDPEPFYGEIPELQGVWATGKTLEACRDDLMSALEDWTSIQAQNRAAHSIDRWGLDYGLHGAGFYCLSYDYTVVLCTDDNGTFVGLYASYSRLPCLGKNSRRSAG